MLKAHLSEKYFQMLLYHELYYIFCKIHYNETCNIFTVVFITRNNHVSNLKSFASLSSTLMHTLKKKIKCSKIPLKQSNMDTLR